jgi:HSP20 family protein
MTRMNILATRPTWPLSRLNDWPDLLGDFTRASNRDAIRLEEFVEDDKLVVRAELPGIDPEKNVEVSISGGMLHINVTREEPAELKDQEGFRTEFRYGSFSRSIALPSGTYESEVKATYDNGILEVRLPIATAAARRIPIHHA